MSASFTLNKNLLALNLSSKKSLLLSSFYRYSTFCVALGCCSSALLHLICDTIERGGGRSSFERICRTKSSKGLYPLNFVIGTAGGRDIDLVRRIAAANLPAVTEKTGPRHWADQRELEPTPLSKAEDRVTISAPDQAIHRMLLKAANLKTPEELAEKAQQAADAAKELAALKLASVPQCAICSNSLGEPSAMHEEEEASDGESADFADFGRGGGGGAAGGGGGEQMGGQMGGRIGDGLLVARGSCNCRSAFHCDCINRWLKDSENCPICQAFEI